MGSDVRFLIGGREYPLAQRTAEWLSQNLIAFDPDLGWDGSSRRSLARAIEHSLVDPREGCITPQALELSALEHKLDHMAPGDREIAVLQRAARRELGLDESAILDKVIEDSD